MRRWAVVVVGGLSAVIALLVVGATHVTSSADRLNRARLDLARVADHPGALRTDEGRAAALRRVDRALRDVDLAEARVQDSWPLRIVGALPWISRQRRAALGLVEDARTASAASRSLLVSLDQLADRIALRNGGVSLTGLAELERRLAATADRMDGLERSSAGLLGALAEARESFNAGTGAIASRLRDGGDALAAAQSFMGADGPRRYFVAVQNNAEMRDQGMVLSFGVARFEDGRLSFERIGKIADLALQEPVVVPIPESTQAVFGSLEPRKLWQSVNATADFAWSGRAMAAMYEDATGQPVDGVIAVDVPGLAALLRVIGPVQVEGIGEQINSFSAGRILLQEFYEDTPQGAQALRRERLAEVLQAVIARLTTRTHDSVGLARELATAAAGGHFRLWSAHEAEEEIFERTGLGGGPAAHKADRSFHLSVQNATSTKLDYYLRQRVRMDVTLTTAGTAIVRTTLTIANTAPVGAAPSYQLGPDGFNQREVGEYVARVYFWVPKGATQLGAVAESGLLLTTAGARIAAGEEATISFETAVPKAVRDGRLDLRLVPQPTLVAPELEVRLVQAPGWKVTGARRVTTAWDRTVTLGWRLRR